MRQLLEDIQPTYSPGDKACTRCGHDLAGRPKGNVKYCLPCRTLVEKERIKARGKTANYIDYNRRYQAELRRERPDYFNACLRRHRAKGRLHNTTKYQKYLVYDREWKRRNADKINAKRREKRAKVRERFEAMKRRPPREDRFRELTVPDYLRTRD